VRELENLLTRAVVLSRGDVLTAADLQFSVGPGERPDGSTMILTLAEAEKAHVEKILRLLEWNITRTAETLQISPTTLRKKITDYGLER